MYAKLPLFLLAAATSFAAETSSEIAISDQDLPKQPFEYEAKEEDTIILETLNGVVIVENHKDINKDGVPNVRGVECIPSTDILPFSVKEIIVEKFLDKPFYKSDLEEIRKDIVKEFRKKGYPLVNVYIPDQEIRDGVLQLLLLKSKVGSVKVKGNRWTSAERIKKYIRLEDGAPIEEDVLLQDINFLNRNPFRKIDVVYVPGKEPGTTDVELHTIEVRPVRLYAGGENNGLQDIGVQRWFTGFNLGNVFGMGHVFSYQFTTSSNFKKFLSHTGSYVMPLPWKHMALLFGGYSQVKSAIPGANNVELSGYSGQISLRYNIPLKPKTEYFHDVIFGFDYKRMNNTIEFTDQNPIINENSINLTQVVGGYSGNYDVLASKFSTDIELFYSPGKWLGEQSSEDYSMFRAGSGPSYIYGRGNISWEKTLPKNFELFLAARGQFSSKSLLPSEQLGFGGYDTIRGYTQRSATGDYGFIINSEIRFPAFSLFRKSKADEMVFLAFVDYGHAFNYHASSLIPSSQWLMGVGPGLRYHINRYLNARADWGWKVNEKQYPGGRSRFDFSFVISY